MNYFLGGNALGVLLLSVLTSVLCLTSPRSAWGAPSDCEKNLIALNDSESEQAMQRAEKMAKILAESHSLYELIKNNPAENLVVQHPTIIMNAAQRVASWILSFGSRSIPNPRYGGGSVMAYDVFSKGLPEAGGRRIIGHKEEIATFVQYVLAAARGSGAGRKMLLLTGPPGTGKSEFLNILGQVAANLTAERPEHFFYTYVWQNLKEFPELRPVLNLDWDEHGVAFEHPLPCPIKESPLVLLPAAYQKRLIEMARQKVAQLAQSEPMPMKDPCPKCHRLRNTLLAAYMKKNGLKVLTPDQEVAALAPYVKIVRKVFATDSPLPKVNPEGKNVDYAGLFFAPNPKVWTVLGQNDPFSYSEGKFLQAHGGMLQLDEFFRQDSALRNTLLEVQENRIVSRGGASVKMDAVMIGASNDNSIERAVSEEGGTNVNAHLDRTRRLPFNYELEPYEIGKTLVHMLDPKIFRQVRLGGGSEANTDALAEGSEQAVTTANLDDLFPERERGRRPLGPDHRYGIWLWTGPVAPPVHISPHALLYISTVVAATRISTDVAQAAKKNRGGSVIHKAYFQNPIERLRILRGEANQIPAAELVELQSVSRALAEGTFGISTRDAASVWLISAMEQAQKPENGNCITPALAHKVFVELLGEKLLQSPNEKTSHHWQLLADAILNEFVVEAVQGDIDRAGNSGTGGVARLYEEVFGEMVARSANASATHWTTESGELREIQLDRYNEIKALYRQVSGGRDLRDGEVLAFHAVNGTKADRRHRDLEAAVNRYLIKRATELISFEDLKQFALSGEGNTEVRSRFGEMHRVLERELGYCTHCMKAALSIAKQAGSGMARPARRDE